MNDHKYRLMQEEILPRVGRFVNAPAKDLGLAHPLGWTGGAPVERDGELHASVYWGSWYVCEALIKDGSLVLHSWAERWSLIGRKEFTLPGLAPHLESQALFDAKVELRGFAYDLKGEIDAGEISPMNALFQMSGYALAKGRSLERAEPSEEEGAVQITLTEHDLEVILLCVNYAKCRAKDPDRDTILLALDRLHQQARQRTGKNLLTRAGTWPATWS